MSSKELHKSQDNLKKKSSRRSKSHRNASSRKKSKTTIFSRQWWQRVGVVCCVAVGAVLVCGLSIVLAMWLRGTLPTRAELPRLKDKFFYHIDRYRPSHLPEADVIGIDLSHYQGRVDFANCQFHLNKSRRMYSSATRKTKVRNVDFVICKCTEGSRYVDPYYKVNKEGARQESLLFGAYHFFSPLSSAKTQAQHFVHNANLHSGDMVPVVDVEAYKKQFPQTDSVLVWLREVERYYKVKPIIYTGHKAYEDYFAKDKRFDKFAFWLARYGGEEPRHRHAFWQAMDNGRVGGVSKMVDVNIFRGTWADLEQYRIP